MTARQASIGPAKLDLMVQIKAYMTAFREMPSDDQHHSASLLDLRAG
jgi:hypothetical protein